MTQCQESVVKLAQLHASTKAKMLSLSEEDCQVFIPWPWEPVSEGELFMFADALRGK